MLLEQSAPTAADKRLINDTGDELWRHAAPKPSTVSVPAFHAPAALAGSGGGDHANTSKAAGVADVIELALVSAQLRPGASDAQAKRLLQRIHRAVPYPVPLVTYVHKPTPSGVVFSVAHKRASKGEAGKGVVADAAETHRSNQPTRRRRKPRSSSAWPGTRCRAVCS